MMKKLLCALFCLCLAASAGCATSADKEVLLVGTESTYPPYEFRSPQNELIGFHIDLVEALGRETGKKIQWVDMSFDALIPSLLTGKIDMIGAGFLMTEARRKRVDFTTHYEVSRGAVITLPSEKERVKSLDDLEGKVVATQLGSFLEAVCMKHGGMTVKSFKKFDDCLREVLYGRAYATTMGLVAAKKYIVQKDFKDKVAVAFIYDLEGTENQKAFAIPKGDPAFKEMLDQALARIEASGELHRRKVKWDLL